MAEAVSGRLVRLPSWFDYRSSSARVVRSKTISLTPSYPSPLTRLSKSGCVVRRLPSTTGNPDSRDCLVLVGYFLAKLQIELAAIVSSDQE